MAYVRIKPTHKIHACGHNYYTNSKFEDLLHAQIEVNMEGLQCIQ